MKKSLFTIVCSIIICLTMLSSVSADRVLPLVVDRAMLLTEAEESRLKVKLEEISNKYSIEVAVVTVESLLTRTAEEYADDFYDDNGYGYGDNDDGILVLFKPGTEGNRELYITTHGKAIGIFTDGEISNFLSEMKSLLIEEDYEGAFDKYISLCEDELSVAFGPPKVSLIWIPISFLIAFLLAFIIAKVQASKLKSVRRKVGATTYVREGSMVLDGCHDIFLYSNISRRPIQRNNSHSSSGTHRSSSGRIHGGGGISF